MRRRAIVLAAVGLAGLVLGLWVLDWWALRLPDVELHANLLRVEVCRGAACKAGVTGIFAIAMLAGGSLLGLVTAAIGVLPGRGVGYRWLVRGQVGLAALALAGAGILLAVSPGLGGADRAIGGWVTLTAVIVCAATGIAILRGDDPRGEAARYEPVKVDVPAEVVDANVKMMGATIPPYAVAQRMASSASLLPFRDRLTPPPPLGPPAAAGTTVPPWQPAIKDLTHTAAPAPRRRSTRAPHTAPPSFDAARQALRFVVAEATIGDDGLAVTLEDHRRLELPWKAFTRAAARQLPPDAPFDKLLVVDLCTVGGQPLRFLPSSRVNYAALPEGAAPNSRENLRRVVALVKSKQPTFGLEHESAAFFAGGREPPACTALRQFVTYDEQYVGWIGATAVPMP